MADDADKKTDETRKPWGDNFDEERAWRLIQDLRTDKAALKTERDDARAELTQASKDRDSAKTDAESAKKELASDRRSAVLKEFEIDDDLAEEFLSGEMPLDELRRKAERLSGRKPKEGDSTEKDDADKGKEKDGDDGQDAGDPKDSGSDGDSGSDSGLPGRPKQRQTTGSGGEPSSELDLDAIAAASRRR